MNNLERSLVSGSLKKTLKFSKEFRLIDSVFKTLSDQFKAATPENFFNQEDRVRVLL